MLERDKTPKSQATDIKGTDDLGDPMPEADEILVMLDWRVKTWKRRRRMIPMVANLRETLHTLAEQLPEDASIEDVIERLRYLRAVEEGKRAADRGEFASDEDVRNAFAKYGIEA